MDSDTRFSNILSKALDSLGYSYSAIKKRSELYTKTFTDNDGTDYNVFIVGSKGEGVSLPLESDLDFMFVPNNFVYFDGVSIHPNFTLKLIKADSPPGYTKLKLENDSDSIDNLDPDIGTDIHEHVGGHNYLSSDKMFEQIIPHMNGSETYLFKIDYNCRAGPSCPMELTTIVGIGIKLDLVCALPCECSDYLSAWCSRERYHGFPLEETIQEVSQMEAHVVPVGYKGCIDQRLQWRICYTLAEIKLIQNFNEAQFQLYVSLKMIAKTVLKPICLEITSYVIKNVVLCVVEITPPQQFKTDHLSRLIAKSLLFLKIVISENFIPNYMIPIRNLLAGKMLLSTKTKLMKALCSLHDKGGSVMLECPEVFKEIVILHKNPELYFTRKSDRDNYIECYLTYQLNAEKLLTKEFETVHEFTDGYLETLPMDLVKKQAYIEMSLCSDNPEYLQLVGKGAIDLILKYPRLQEFFKRILTENDDCDSVTSETTSDELGLAKFLPENDVTQLFSKYMIPLYDAYFGEMVPFGRVMEDLSANRDFLSELFQLSIPLLSGDCVKMLKENDVLARVCSGDAFKLFYREYLSLETVENRKMFLTNPVVHNFFTKMLCGGSV